MIILDIPYGLRARFVARTKMESFHFAGVCAAYQRNIRLWPREGFSDLDSWERYLWSELARNDISPEDALDIFEFMFPAWYFTIENRWQETYDIWNDLHDQSPTEGILMQGSKALEDFRILNRLRLAVRLWATDYLPETPPHPGA